MNDPIGQFVDVLAAHHVELHSLTVIEGDQTLVQFAVAPWTLERSSLVYSMSKTFTSAAFGICRDRGLLHESDRLVDLFPDLAGDDLSEQARAITIGDCLAMASGHTFDTISLMTNRWWLNRDALGDFLRAPIEGIPGTTFSYNQLCTFAVSVAISQVSGSSVQQLVRSEILDPMGAQPTYWTADPAGYTLGFSGHHIAPIDLAAFIGLLAHEGRYRGRQLLPAAWLADYAIKRVETAGPDQSADWAQGYGWQVWRGLDGGHRADGAYGQFGLIWPERNLAVVITSVTDDMQVVIDAVREHLLPHLTQLRAPAALTVPTPTGGAEFADWHGGDGRGGSLAVTSIEAGWSLHWRDVDGGDHSCEIGHQRWCDTALTWPATSPELGAAEAEVSLAAAVNDTGQLVVHLACTQTPHTAVWVLTPGAHEAEFSWRHQPLGHDSVRGLALPAGWREHMAGGN